ncbi:MAG TPA: HNH endonuclease, partial [Nitrosopumilaceae archaeon]|nr:HNH endonuclease [Nitrosopumilaceae archaeon]
DNAKKKRNYQASRKNRLWHIAASCNARSKKYNRLERVTVAEIRELFNQYHDICAYCGEAAHMLDHIIPMARGGTSAIENLVPCCWTCNCNKASNILNVEWFAPIHIHLTHPEIGGKYPLQNNFKWKHLSEYVNNENACKI